MAMPVNGGGGLRSRRGRHNMASLSEINVTPFVDVVLVLLIIFMLTAHVMEYGIEVDVPETRYVQETNKDVPVITVDKTGEYTVQNGIKINIHEIGPVIRKMFPGTSEVFLRADKGTVWDPVAQMLAALSEAKFKVNVVYQPVDTSAKGR